MNKLRISYVIIFALATFFSCKPEYSSTELTRLNSQYVQSLQYDSIPHNNSHSQIEKAVAYVDSVYNRLDHPSVAEQLFKYDRLVTFRFKERKFSKAINYCDSIIDLIDQHKAISIFPTEYAMAYFWEGDCYSLMGDYMKAYECYFDAQQLTSSHMGTCLKGEYDYRIAMSLFREGQYREAGRFFNSCTEPTEQCSTHVKYVYRRQELLSNIGLCFAKMKEYDSALYYYQKALLKIADNAKLQPEEFQEDVARGVVMGNMGKTYLAKGDTSKAIACLKQNIEINLKPFHDSHDALFSLLEMASVYTARSDFKNAANCLSAVRRSLDTLYYTDTKSLLLLAEGAYYTRKKDLGKAAISLKAYITLRDSAEQVIRHSKEMDVQQYITTLHQKHENRVLKEENRRKQTIVIYTVAVGLFFVVLLLGGLFLYRRTNEYVHTLSILNTTIEQQNKELEQRNKDKDHILRIVAHDLRNPIWGIHALSRMMLDDMASDDKQRESIQLIHRSSESTITLIHELMDATIGLSEDIEKAPYDPGELISEVVELQQLRASEKNIHLIWENKDDELPLVLLNREKMSRVLQNLVFNAIKFSYTGGTVSIAASNTGTNVLIQVKDEGIGIPAEWQEKIFETFTSAKRTGTAGEKSFGLGLSICRSIAQAHGGKLWVESNEGSGSVFYLELPLT